MLPAFRCASLAQVGADRDHLYGITAANTHQLCRGIANGGAFHVELDAAGHHLNVLLLCTGRGAMIANGCATQAGVDAVFIEVISVLHLSVVLCESASNTVQICFRHTQHFFFIPILT
jgi:hypothetical protein